MQYRFSNTRIAIFHIFHILRHDHFKKDATIVVKNCQHFVEENILSFWKKEQICLHLNFNLFFFILNLNFIYFPIPKNNVIPQLIFLISLLCLKLLIKDFIFWFSQVNIVNSSRIQLKSCWKLLCCGNLNLILPIFVFLCDLTKQLFLMRVDKVLTIKMIVY